jgi:hypothetical protein
VTTTVEEPKAPGVPTRRGLSSLQKALLVVPIVWVATVPIFWYLEVHAGVSHDVAGNAMTVFHVLLFITALALPWLKLPGQGERTRSERLGSMIIVWLFIALMPRFVWELPWLLALDQIKQGVQDGALWSYVWSPYLLGGDTRYLTGDPLIVTLEWIAVFVGAFELYALVQFFRQGKRFTNLQLSFVMGGMIVEVMLPAVYFGMEIASGSNSTGSAADLWIKFILLNSFWCTMPLVTYFWGVRRLSTQQLEVAF